jgi:hypothetical protein
MFDTAYEERPKVATKNTDDEIMDVYMNHRHITGHTRREAETTRRSINRSSANRLKTRSATMADGKIVSVLHE